MGRIVIKYGLIGFMSLVLSILLILVQTQVSAQTKTPVRQIVWKMDSMWPPNDPETLPLLQAANEIFEYTEVDLR